jgi:hypothetical protein
MATPTATENNHRIVDSWIRSQPARWPLQGDPYHCQINAYTTATYSLSATPFLPTSGLLRDNIVSNSSARLLSQREVGGATTMRARSGASWAASTLLALVIGTFDFDTLVAGS